VPAINAGRGARIVIDAFPAAFERLLTPATGVIALAARHVESGRIWRRHERRLFPAASLIKLPILASFRDAVEAGSIDPMERTTVAAHARVEGTGVLKALAPGLTPTWEDLATLMITVSDNVATNLLIDRLGMDHIGRWIAGAGLTDTRLERRMMDRSAMSAGRSNWTSAADIETLLAAVVAGTCVSRDASAGMRRAFEAQQIQDRLARRLPEGVTVANKTGNFADVLHDAGILAWPGGTLVVAAFTEGIRPPWLAMDTIAEIAVELIEACER
jgi:beta-lactamase class A